MGLCSFSKRLFLGLTLVGGGVDSRDMNPRLRPDPDLLGVKLFIVALFVLLPFFVDGEGSGVMRSIDTVGVTLVGTLVGLSSCSLLGCPYDGRLRRFAPRSDPLSDEVVGLPSREPCEARVGLILESACSCFSDSFESLALSLAIDMAAETRCCG
jgi:hypothetical protein